jgi:hypothetical protein
LARLAQGSYKALTDEQENGEAERRIELAIGALTPAGGLDRRVTCSSEVPLSGGSPAVAQT